MIYEELESGIGSIRDLNLESEGKPVAFALRAEGRKMYRHQDNRVERTGFTKIDLKMVRLLLIRNGFAVKPEARAPWAVVELGKG